MKMRTERATNEEVIRNLEEARKAISDGDFDKYKSIALNGFCDGDSLNRHGYGASTLTAGSRNLDLPLPLPTLIVYPYTEGAIQGSSYMIEGAEGRKRLVESAKCFLDKEGVSRLEKAVDDAAEVLLNLDKTCFVSDSPSYMTIGIYNNNSLKHWSAGNMGGGEAAFIDLVELEIYASLKEQEENYKKFKHIKCFAKKCTDEFINWYLSEEMKRPEEMNRIINSYIGMLNSWEGLR